jgi:hypothetical protein
LKIKLVNESLRLTQVQGFCQSQKPARLVEARFGVYDYGSYLYSAVNGINGLSDCKKELDAKKTTTQRRGHAFRTSPSPNGTRFH